VEHGTGRAREGGMSAPSATVAAESGLRARRLRTLVTNPWARPRFLWLFAIAYVLWMLVPVGTAALFSFNGTRSISIWSSFSLRWYITDPNESVLHDPDLRHAVVQSLKLATGAMIVAVPIGVAFALALDKWRSRASGTANFLMMFSFITPELILAVSLFLLFLNPFKALGLGTASQLLGLGLLAIPYVVIIVRSRLLSLGVDLEEAAMDLGASPIQAVRRVTLPLLGPSIFASAAIIFAFTLDDFVMVKQLARTGSDQTVAMAIYGAARTAPSPAVNAIGTLMLVTSTLVIAVAYVLYRRAVRRSGGGIRTDRNALPI
jgi:spermidine/putrescine transport system permease protein